MARRIDTGPDPLDDDAFGAWEARQPSPPDGSVAGALARPKVTAEERRARQAQKKRSEAATIARRTQMRRQWENSPDGQNRMRQVNADNPSVGVGLHYAVRQWGSESSGPRAGVFGKDDPQAGKGFREVQLPGLENPHAAPQPPRWEELPDTERAKAERKLKLHAGVDVDFMSRAFGAQLDQAHERAARNTPPGMAVVPHGRDHYVEGDQAARMKQTAKELGVPYGVHVAVSAFTSPNTKFRQHSAAGDVVYPNDEAAANVIRQVQGGTDPRDVTNRIPGTNGRRAQGYETNMRKAADVYEQTTHGVPLHEAVVRYDTRHGGDKEKPTNPFGPKTAPYHNSYLSDTPDFLVADVHTGGGGMLPHLSYEKPVKRDRVTGDPVMKPEFRRDPDAAPRNADGTVSEKAYDRTKSAREEVIEKVPHFHAMADFAARRALTERGMGSVRQAQASQWYEEQIQRTEKRPQLALLNEEKAYGHLSQQFGRKEIPGQEKLL